MLMDITELLPEAAPDLYSMIPEDYWRAVSVNGAIYGVPTYKDSSITEYFIWDKDVADKYDIDIESITTLRTLLRLWRKSRREKAAIRITCQRQGPISL